MNYSLMHLNCFGIRLTGLLALSGLLFMGQVAHGNPVSSESFQEALKLIKAEQ